MEPVRIHVLQMGNCLSSWESLSLRTSELSWSLALCSFPDTVHPSQHSRWDNGKRTYYDQWWHPAENQVLHGRPLSPSWLHTSCTWEGKHCSTVSSKQIVQRLNKEVDSSVTDSRNSLPSWREKRHQALEACAIPHPIVWVPSSYTVTAWALGLLSVPPKLPSQSCSPIRMNPLASGISGSCSLIICFQSQSATYLQTPQPPTAMAIPGILSSPESAHCQNLEIKHPSSFHSVGVS